MGVLYIDNPVCIEVSRLIACGGTEVISDAVVEATIYDSDGGEVTGQVWPLVLAYNATDEIYSVTTESGLGLTESLVYTTVVIAKTIGGSVMATFNVRKRAKLRLSE